MPQFFIKQENIRPDEILINNLEDIRHILNVLRLSKGDNLILVGGGGIVYNAEIFSIQHGLIHTKVIESYKSDKILSINITLAQSILKSQKQDFVIQKSTEIGVNRIIPFFSKNTVVKIETQQDKSQKIKRWQKIAHESSKQCQRINIPDIDHIGNLAEVIHLSGFDIKFVCSERDTELSLKTFLKEYSNKQEGSEYHDYNWPRGGMG